MPSPDRRSIRDINSAYEGMKDFQLETGQWVQWFRFNKSGSTSHPVYGQGPQRAWYPPVVVPVISAVLIRGKRDHGTDGLYIVDTLNLLLSYKAFFSSAMPDPDTNGQNHLSDRIGFDGILFSADSFIPRSRVASQYLTISVTAIQLAQEEIIEDLPVPMFQSYVLDS